MYQPMLFIHWKQVRLGLLPFVVAAFALPLLSVQGLGGMLTSSRDVYRAVAAAEVWLPLYPVLAVSIGLTLALSAWSWDHQLKHVHALSLPLARWEYVLLKMGAGVVLALLPTAAFWIGANVAAASISLPVGLHTYPNQLTVRFLLAVLVCYSAVFAAAAGTVRTVAIAFTTFVGLLVVAGLVGDILPAIFPSMEYVDPASWIIDSLVEHPGPFAVFTGNWSLIDV